MMQPLRLHYVQADLQWEDSHANLKHLSELISGLEGDVILLPEMFSTGFTVDPQNVAEGMSGTAVTWMLEAARNSGAVVIGSLVIGDTDHYYNRLICAEPDGVLNYYNKRHLFTYAGEHHSFAPGKHHLLLTVKGWRILPLVCYDLRFPVWSRNTQQYDLLVYVANWPAPRIHAWTTLLQARAIENQCYVAGVNRVGEDPNGNHYSGQSAVYDMAGQPLRTSASAEEVGTIDLDAGALQVYRQRFPFLQDRDQFQILE